MSIADTPSIASLFSWVDSSGTTNVLDVDVVMNVSDKRTAKLTDHVVEDGSVITDHVIIEPESIILELIVTQTPISGPDVALAPLSVNTGVTQSALVPKTYPLVIPPNSFVPGGFLLLSQGLRSVVSDLLGGVAPASQMQGSDFLPSIPSKGTIQTLQSATPQDRVVAAHDQLIAILDNALPVTISFKGKLYLDYLLTEVELHHQAGKFGAGSFRVSARAFRTVTGTNVNLPDPADFRAKPSVQKGNKPAKTGDPDPNKGPAKTIAAHALDGDITKGFADLAFGLKFGE